MKIINKADQVREGLRERIISGEFGRRGRLPSLRMLATEYKISQETINKVIQVLQAEGWILSLGQRGVFVNMPRVRIPGNMAYSAEYFKNQGLEVLEENIEAPQVVEPPIEIAESMGILPKTLVVRRHRRNGIPNVIYRISDVYFPKILIDDELLAKMNEPNYEVLPQIKLKSGKFIKHINESVLARFPTEYEQDLLKIVRTNPVIDIKRINYTLDKKTVVMFSHIVLNANHFLLSYNYSIDVWD